MLIRTHWAGDELLLHDVQELLVHILLTLALGGEQEPAPQPCQPAVLCTAVDSPVEAAVSTDRQDRVVLSEGADTAGSARHLHLGEAPLGGEILQTGALTSGRRQSGLQRSAV